MHNQPTPVRATTFRYPHHPQDPRALALFGRTFEHPIIGAIVEWVPTAWLQALSNPEVDGHTDLGTWATDAPLVGMETLWRNLLATGMRDPFLVGVGRVTRKVRLEAGNHRVNLLQAKGLLWVPAVAYVGDTSITHRGNGTHEGAEMPLRLETPVCDIMGP